MGLFLVWSKKVGNDLTTPHPEYGFPGLKEGDSWCLCATWYARALEEDVACSIYLKKTNIKTLDLIPIEKLKKFFYKYKVPLIVVVSTLIIFLIGIILYTKSVTKKE